MRDGTQLDRHLHLLDFSRPQTTKTVRVGASKRRKEVPVWMLPDPKDVYYALDNEMPKQIAAKLNMDAALLVQMNKGSYPDLNQNAKLKRETPLEVPVEVPPEHRHAPTPKQKKSKKSPVASETDKVIKKSKKSPVTSETDKVIFGNTHKKLEEDIHEWTCFIRGGSEIKEVTFYIHQDYTPSEIVVTEPPFEITRTGYGIFEIAVDIKMIDGVVSKHKHDLNFDQDITFDTICISRERKKSKTTTALPKKVASFAPVPIVFGNTHKKVSGDMPHQWTLFVRGADGKKNTKRHFGVEKVTFFIHQDYDPSEITIEKPPFELEPKVGYATFDVAAEITFKNGKKIKQARDLNFDKAVSFEEVIIPEIEKKAKKVSKKAVDPDGNGPVESSAKPAARTKKKKKLPVSESTPPPVKKKAKAEANKPTSLISTV